MAIKIEIQKKLADFQLDVKLKSDSKRIGILGASGCGKSMTLKSIAGIETPDTGQIVIGDKRIFDSEQKINWKPQKRNIGYMFQNYALFPTMTVKANIAAGLHGRKAEKSYKEQQVAEMIRKFQLQGLESRYPGELSGGQQQRVALARIMAYEPEAILLDEPYSALDVFLKDRLQQEMQEMLADYEGTVILVSHSRDEIYRFSEELLILEQGSTIRHGRTNDVFENPICREAARLTGCKNITPAQYMDEHTLEIPDWGITMRLRQKIPEKTAYMGVRAHDFVPLWGEPKGNCLPVRVKSTARLLFETKYFLKVPGQEAEEVCWFVQREQQNELEQKGLPEYLMIPEGKVLLLE